MQRTIFGLFLLISTLSSTAQIQPLPQAPADTLQLSLQEAWQRAAVSSRKIAISKTTAGVAEEEIKDAKLERYPEVGLMSSVEKATNIPIYDKGIFGPAAHHEVIHTLYRVGADLYLNIYNGNATNLKIEEAETLHAISRIREDETISAIRYKTASLYLDLQQSLVFQQLIKADIADQEKQLQEIKAFYKNGTVLKTDVLRAVLDLSRRRLTLVTIDNDILIASQKLNIILGTPDETVIRPLDPEPATVQLEDYPQYLETAYRHAFAYQVSAQQEALSEIKLKQVKSTLQPKLGLYGDFYYANPQIFLYPYNPFWYSLGIAGLKLSYPLSNLYHSKHKLSAAKLELQKEEEAHHDVADQVRQQVKEAWLRYQEALVQIRVAEVNLAQAEENERILRNNYYQHTVLITDLLDANVQVLQTRFDLAAAKIKAQDKYYLLQHITGIL